MKMTSEIYCKFLIHSQKNFTGTYLAAHSTNLKHDDIYLFLKYSEFRSVHLWERVKGEIEFTEVGYLLFDDSVLDKGYSHEIQGVRRQYSGNAHGIIKGIGLVSCVYYNPNTDEFHVVDFRIFDPERDGKSKLDHVREMLELALKRGIKFRKVLMDSWYATKDLMLLIENMGKIFYCPLKKNRLVDDSGGTTKYRAIENLDWNAEELKSGKTIKIKDFPKEYKVKLFRVAVSSDRTDWLVTNEPTQNSTIDARKESACRWKIEQFHREIKQTTGIEKCQCRLNRSQRNHIALALFAWVALKKYAKQIQTTVYQVKERMIEDFMTLVLQNPIVKPV